MPHFFINSNDIKNNKIIISDKDTFNHLAKSLRIRKGEDLLLIDENQIQYETTIAQIDSKKIICEIKKSYPSKRDLEFDLYLAQSPLRSDAQLTVMEKATELGVRGVYPIFTDNCALKVNKQEKWQKVMVEASKQCERAKIPSCFSPITFDLLLGKQFDRVIVFAERSTEISLKQFLKQNPTQKGDKILVIIGPEGGFSEKEFDYFKSKNLPLVSLGDLILKAETAVITALGDIVYEYQG